MALAAVHDKKTTNNAPKDVLGGTITINVSPASGIVPTAKTSTANAGNYVTASVLGTGMNADTLTNTREAV